MNGMTPVTTGGRNGSVGLPGPQSSGPDNRASRAASLTRKQKAAIIVRLLSNEGAEVPLSQLDEDLQAELTKQMGEMRYVDRSTLSDVVAEFAGELDSFGLAFPGNLAGALRALDGKISPQTAARLRKEAGVRQAGDPWERIGALPVARLKDFVTSEATEISAVLLSKIDTAKAAELLSQIPGPEARRVTYAISLTKSVTPDAVDRIGVSLAAQLDSDPVTVFEAEPPKRVGAILNFSSSATRDALLSELEDEDSDFASEVRKNIFTFADIPDRIGPNDAGVILRELDEAVKVTALSYARATGLDEAVDFLLDNISKRLAEGIRETVNEADPPKEKEGEAALAAFVGVIRNLIDQGQVAMIAPDDTA